MPGTRRLSHPLGCSFRPLTLESRSCAPGNRISASPFFLVDLSWDFSSGAFIDTASGPSTPNGAERATGRAGAFRGRP